MSFWILKTEAETYSISDLKRDGTSIWDGVRNYQARNNLRLMAMGDQALIYHSGGPKELVGRAEVVKTAFLDPSATDGDWVAVKLRFVDELSSPIKLATLKDHPLLKNLSLVKQSRLSVCPVTKEEWKALLELSIREKA